MCVYGIGAEIRARRSLSMVWYDLQQETHLSPCMCTSSGAVSASMSSFKSDSTSMLTQSAPDCLETAYAHLQSDAKTMGYQTTSCMSIVS